MAPIKAWIEADWASGWTSGPAELEAVGLEVAELKAADSGATEAGAAELAAGSVLPGIPTTGACTKSAADQNSTTIVHLPGRWTCRGRHEPY